MYGVTASRAKKKAGSHPSAGAFARSSSIPLYSQHQSHQTIVEILVSLLARNSNLTFYSFPQSYLLYLDNQRNPTCTITRNWLSEYPKGSGPEKALKASLARARVCGRIEMSSKTEVQQSFLTAPIWYLSLSRSPNSYLLYQSSMPFIDLLRSFPQTVFEPSRQPIRKKTTHTLAQTSSEIHPSYISYATHIKQTTAIIKLSTIVQRSDASIKMKFLFLMQGRQRQLLVTLDSILCDKDSLLTMRDRFFDDKARYIP